MKKRYFLSLVTASVILASCTQETLRYGSEDNVYFDYSLQKNDSMQVFTFAYTPEVQSDTVYLPVRLSGERKPYDRKFKLQVNKLYNTAIPGTHFKLPEDSYTLMADSGLTMVPIVVYNTDRNLEETSVLMSLELVPTDDLGVTYKKAEYNTVSISNRLEKPIWWNQWDGSLAAYSRTKHALYLIAVGNIDLITDPITQNALIPYCLFVVDNYRQFLNDPFKWTESNTKGYVLTERPEGNAYDFYTPSNPYKVYKLKLNEGEGKYYFIDENGEQVTIN